VTDGEFEGWLVVMLVVLCVVCCLLDLKQAVRGGPGVRRGIEKMWRSGVQ